MPCVKRVRDRQAGVVRRIGREGLEIGRITCDRPQLCTCGNGGRGWGYPPPPPQATVT
jgi:hypothetical protein